jgi:hypothetical protein
MSRHWKPDKQLARAAEATPWGLVQTRVQPAQRRSAGASAALVLLTGACVFVAAGLLQAL